MAEAELFPAGYAHEGLAGSDGAFWGNRCGYSGSGYRLGPACPACAALRQRGLGGPPPAESDAECDSVPPYPAPPVPEAAMADVQPTTTPDVLTADEARTELEVESLVLAGDLCELARVLVAALKKTILDGAETRAILEDLQVLDMTIRQAASAAGISRPAIPQSDTMSGA